MSSSNASMCVVLCCNVTMSSSADSHTRHARVLPVERGTRGVVRSFAQKAQRVQIACVRERNSSDGIFLRFYNTRRFTLYTVRVRCHNEKRKVYILHCQCWPKDSLPVMEVLLDMIDESWRVGTVCSQGFYQKNSTLSRRKRISKTRKWTTHARRPIPMQWRSRQRRFEMKESKGKTLSCCIDECDRAMRQWRATCRYVCAH